MSLHKEGKGGNAEWGNSESSLEGREDTGLRMRFALKTIRIRSSSTTN